MYFERQQNGKPVVEFSAANYTSDSFVPSLPYQNYIDEVVYITDDPRITGTLGRSSRTTGRIRSANFTTTRTSRHRTRATIRSSPRIGH
jgi:hypothetical protein